MFIKKIISLVTRKYIKGTNSSIICHAKIPQKSKIQIYGNNSIVLIEKGCIIENTNICISGDNSKIIFKKGVVIRKGKFLIEGNDASIFIDENTTIREASLLAVENHSQITIGKDCMFSYEILLRTSDSHSILNKVGERVNFARNIVIGNHVWIAERVTILKGASVGDNSVIGYGSVVTHNFQNNSLIVGIPAKVIKSEINWDRKLI